ncbi:hypothetical protein FS815_17285 [Agrobacterium vitis]|uniref:hypothetical protein n=1 Tax=Allorhizobium ampelinum TaxID=3025782 RepID=UPI001F2D639B|nr:hypothetical protein [Allorhizobium ampelinum]MCF1448572.1 hypothetical protein [Allorhizobium ampelinum]
MYIAKFYLLTALLSLILVENASTEERTVNFKDDVQIGNLCKSGLINIYVPSEDLDAPQVKKDDNNSCQWTFAAVNKDNFVLSNFGIYLIKDPLRESDRQRFAEFIIKEYIPSNDTYINFNEKISDGAFDDYKFEIGLKNGDETRVSNYHALFSESKFGTLMIFSTTPKIFSKTGTVNLNNGGEFNVSEEQNKIYNYINFWRSINIELISKQIK